MDNPFAKASATASAKREDKDGPKKPSKSDSATTTEQVRATLKTKLELNQDKVAEVLRKFSTNSVAKFSSVPVENYKAVLEALEAIK